MTITIEKYIDNYHLVTINGVKTVYVRARNDSEAIEKTFDFLVFCGKVVDHK